MGTPTFKWLLNASDREANVDGSSTPVEFSYEVPDGSRFDATRIIVTIQDAGTFDAELYGNGAVLTTGVDVEVQRANGQVSDLLDGFPIKSNADWQALCYDFAYNDIGTGDNVGVIRWTFEKAGDDLVLNQGDKFVVTINDNLTVLTGHRFMLQGSIPSTQFGP